MNNKLTEYIQSSLKIGKTKEQIKTELLSAGWKDSDINDAILQSEIPLWAKLSFKAIGIFWFLLGLFSILGLIFPVIDDVNFLFSYDALGFYGIILQYLTLGVGFLLLKRWVIVLFGYIAIANLISLFMGKSFDGVSVVGTFDWLFMLLIITVLIFAIFFRKYLGGRFINYLIVFIFILGIISFQFGVYNTRLNEKGDASEYLKNLQESIQLPSDLNTAQ